MEDSAQPLIFLSSFIQEENFRHIFSQAMPFLLPNQQCQKH